MAGQRGRPSTSLTQDQLMALGVNSKDMQPVTNAPPPIFPPLFSKPAPLETRNSRDYKILWKEDFISFLKDSPYYTNPSIDSDNKIQRYSDKYIQIFTKTKDRKNGDFPWDQMPFELRPNWKRKKEVTGPEKKKTKVVNIEETLKVLEEKEKVKVPEVVEKESDPDDNVEEEVDEHDEEMDEDNDYGNSYFDNGDAYNDEDDNLDDGPVY